MEQKQRTSKSYEDIEPSRLIAESNWPVYESRKYFAYGVTIDEYLKEMSAEAQEIFGADNIFLGDAWSYEVHRPLKHKPNVGIYVHSDGREYLAKQVQRLRSPD